MNGPTTHWAVLNDLFQNPKRDQIPAFEDIGSCSLHIFSGAFQNGIKTTSFDLDKILKSLVAIIS